MQNGANNIPRRFHKDSLSNRKLTNWKIKAHISGLFYKISKPINIEPS